MEQGLVKKETLTAIGNSIRAKNGTQDTYTPAEMPGAIDAIEAGGGGYEPTAEDLTITGVCSDRFAHGAWDWVINNYGNKMTTKNITEAYDMFGGTKVDKIPFELNFMPAAQAIATGMFRRATKLKEIPIFHNCQLMELESMFEQCQEIEYFPENFADGFNFSYIDKITSPYSGTQQNLFYQMSKLRKLPMPFLQHGNPYCYYSYSYYNFYQCHCLDEIIDLPNPYYKAEWTSNAFGGYNPAKFLDSCWHLKDLTFAPMMTNGEPNCPKWSNQVVDVTSVGTGGAYYFSAEKEIKDDATYQQLKNDKDSWTRFKEYSRYNHDSAVRTINSLPDTSAFIASNGGTNTIKFSGNKGSKTDGGAINTLTPEEIAVATAKGWTVTLT